MTQRIRRQPWPYRAIDALAAERAEAIAARLAPWLPDGPLLDVGSGTGHNAEAIRSLTGAQVLETDIADFHRRGPGPRISRGGQIPFKTGEFAAALALHVLQYPADPAALLHEMARVSRGRILVLQTVGARPAMAINEWVGTPGAFLASRWIGYIPPRRCTVWPRRLFPPSSLERLARGWGFKARRLERGLTWGLRDDLYALEPLR